MPQSPSLALRLFVFAALCVAGFPAEAASLAEAIKAEDAKYLDAKEPAKGDAPRIEAGSGEEEQEPGPREIAQGKLKAALTYNETKGEDGEIARAPVVTIFEDGAEVAKLDGEDSGMTDPPVAVEIAEIDPGNDAAEVVVSFYSGGAHCCSETKVLTKAKDGSGWKTVELGSFDGGPLLATDPLSDGSYVFETRDNAFLYAFGCYACSTAPLEILTVADGEVKDVSAEPRYRPVHEAYLKDMIVDVPEEDVNGFLAGYVGEKIRLGEGAAAWTIMLDHYDKEADWGRDVCDQPLDDDGACPGTETKVTFPVALERMLNENGYKVEK